MEAPPAKHLKSCARCRKHKTKCNYAANAPHACTSCAKRGLACHFEAVFPIKRSNIIKNLATDIESLKGLVNELVMRENTLKSLCKSEGIVLSGLLDVPPYAETCTPNGECPLEAADPVDPVDPVDPIVTLDQTLNAAPVDPASATGFTLPNSTIHYSHAQITSLFNNFGLHHVQFVPIFDSVDPTYLHQNEPVTFWTIVFILTQNTTIFSSHILGAILNNLHGGFNNEKLQYVRSIILLATFPSKNVSTPLDRDDELDTSVFQWLTQAKNWIDSLNVASIPYYEETKALLMVQGTFASLRLGIQWSQSLDCDLAFRSGDSYLPQMLNIAILLNKLFNTVAFGKNHSDNTDLARKALQNWEFKFASLKSKFESSSLTALQTESLGSVFKLIPLLFTLLKPVDDRTAFVTDCLEQCQDLYVSLKTMDLNAVPLFHMISLEFLALVTTKSIYSPQNTGSTLAQVTLVTNVFNKCLNSIDYNDMRPVLNIIMDFDSSLKLDSSLLCIDSFRCFHDSLIQGIVQDLKVNCHKFQSSYTVPSPEEFSLQNVNFKQYLASFNWIRSNLDLIILFSNRMFQEPASTSSSISVSPSISHHVELMSETLVKQEQELDNLSYLELSSQLSPWC